MTLTPDDLPASGAQQVICACLGDRFRVVLNGGTEIVAECVNCGSTANRFPTLAGLGLTTGQEQIIGPGRDRLLLPGETSLPYPGPMVGSAWGAGPPPAPPQEARPMGEDEIRKAMDIPAPLPAFSPEVANTHLSGGPYDGQITWLVPGLTEFLVSGMQGRYVPDPHGQLREGEDGTRRPVYVFVPSVQP
jgi:hypothetical protein